LNQGSCKISGLDCIQAIHIAVQQYDNQESAEVESMGWLYILVNQRHLAAFVCDVLEFRDLEYISQAGEYRAE
jgi:hypothetical protein